MYLRASYLELRAEPVVECGGVYALGRSILVINTLVWLAKINVRAMCIANTAVIENAFKL